VAETGAENLILTDAAPLAFSAETEYLARFVDAAIIVVESGVTTRTQLQQAAATVQRLDVGAVGFVLNRVSLDKADAPFRQSIDQMEDYLRAQSGSFKQDLEAIQQQRRQLLASEAAATPRGNYLPKPDTHVFYVSEWKSKYPDGDVEAALVEAKRLGYEVVQ
jgi:Mrp family chromosome partitioning ATPase